MAKYITLPTILWAIEQLRDSCNKLFVDLLILKHEGLSPDHPVTIRTMSTESAARRLMGVSAADGTPVDSDHAFFNPFAPNAPWRHVGYPRSGTYSTLDRSKTFSRVFRIDKTGVGMTVTPTDNYIESVKNDLRRSVKRPIDIPIVAMSIWTQRYDSFDESDNVEAVVGRFRDEYNLTEEETSAFFNRDIEAPEPIFGQEPIRSDAFIEALFSLAPREVSPDHGGAAEAETLGRVDKRLQP
ncbi:hypothetical protein BH11PSE5_BH11PSE5_08650 [soil metagenome]|uniref:Uncharacterized protein n=1 Tax=Sphingomonas echinoides TaxID=59803 RepID=A0ABU4PT43_9SPHN|nr:hypothetical protein [Sphingomonas echinoides]MDX5986392.1 hypothetical protein [Sphingomonas echinoides]